jgi:hypothetical protein
MQKEAPSTHLLLVHKPEQQREDDPPSAPPSAPDAPPALQGLPAVRQAVLSGTHLPELQFWPQHSPEVAQVWLSATQLAALAHTPRAVSHWRLQQSVATLQELPEPLHTVTEGLHLLVTGSQMLEQHCPLLVQEASATVHTTFDPPAPGVPTSPGRSPAASGSVLCPELRFEHALETTARNDQMTICRRWLFMFVSSMWGDRGSGRSLRRCSADRGRAFSSSARRGPCPAPIAVRRSVTFPARGDMREDTGGADVDGG